MKDTEDQVLLMLGEIKGQVGEISKKQAAFETKLDSFDARLRKQEIRSGTIATIVTLGVTLAIETAKKTFVV